jgi:mRNA interferase MazF
MLINQGDLYWVQFNEMDESASTISHPHVILQDDLLNHSRIETVITCALTSNLHRVNMPGNVLLDQDEGNLAKRSVVEVSKLFTVEKAQLGEYIGSLSEDRIRQILAGIRFLQTSFLMRES